VIVHASSSPDVVPIPYSNPGFVDPEEGFIAAISSCHMLWFLGIAARKNFVVGNYLDRAIGIMEQNEDRKLAIVSICLRPEVSFIGENLPTGEQIAEMHDLAHHSCFIANSVRTNITIQLES
jgi:organic hydroperoxide reductase OsmC/OhrA